MELETTTDVAKAATEDQLKQLWDHLAPTLGNERAFVRLAVPVPGAPFWGNISRIQGQSDDDWTLNYDIFSMGIDPRPYYFVDQIEPGNRNHLGLMVSLPQLLLQRRVRAIYSVSSL